MSIVLKSSFPEQRAGLSCYWQEQVMIPHVTPANNFWTRLKGLLGRKELGLNQGILLEPCHSVHTLGMKFEIAVIFLNQDNQIVHLIAHMPPGKMSPVIAKSRRVLECHPDLLKQYPLQIGNQLAFKGP